MKKQNNQLRITEIFHSLQGESTNIGLPTVFVRLTGCPLRCTYCDSAYAFNGGTLISIEDIIKKIASFSCKHVCITGGEPLAQPNAKILLSKLCDNGFRVSLETSGAIDIANIDQQVLVVMDIKTPSSNEADKNILANLLHLKTQDQIKFVICNQKDYEWSCEFIEKNCTHANYEILFSPSWQELEPHTLANWIIRDKITVRMQIQLHKYLWGDIPGV